MSDVIIRDKSEYHARTSEQMERHLAVPPWAFWHHPPTSKALDRPDFHRGLGFARRFARKGREIAPGLRRMG
jgi:hypothetical protein